MNSTTGRDELEVHDRIEKLTSEIAALHSKCAAIEDTVNSVTGVKQKTNWLDYTQKLAGLSTLHAVGRIAGDEHLWTRVFWTVLLLAAVGTSAWQVTGLVSEFYTYPVYVEVGVHYGVSLPQFTICSNNAYLRSKVENHPVFANHSILSLNRSAFTPQAYDEFLTEMHALPLDERRNLSYGPNELGFAYYYDVGYERRNITPTVYDSYKHGNCYTYQPPENINTIHLYMNMHYKENLNLNLASPNMVFSLSPPGVEPKMSATQTRAVSGGKVVVSNLKTDIITRLNGSYGNCKDHEDEYEATRGIPYSKLVCVAECNIMNAIRKCNCVTRFPEVSVLNKFKNRPNPVRRCEKGEEEECFNAEYARHSVFTGGCGCKPECHSKTYRIKSEEIRLHYMGFLQACFYFGINCSRQRIPMANFAVYELRYEGYNYKEFRQKPLYPLARFMSDLGGTLGLYLGASFLTMFELVHFMPAITVFLFNRQRLR